MGRWLAASLFVLATPVMAQEGGVCQQAQAPGDRPPVCMDAFFEVLQPWGTWVQTDRYGTLFCPDPARFSPDFRPYRKGHWVMGAEGWIFVGDHPTSWVTDHYGRWVETNLSGCPWGWVPGEIWSPAWVEFHVGERVIAWRPAPFDGVPVQLRVPRGVQLQVLRIGTGPQTPSSAAFTAVRDGDFASRNIEDVALDGPELMAALKEVVLLPDARAGLHSQERYQVVAQMMAAREAAALRAEAVPPEPAQRIRRQGVAGTVQKSAGREAQAPGPQPGQTPPGAGKVYWGGDRNQGGFTQPGPEGGVRVLEWGKSRKRPLPPPRNPGEKHK
ncbi:MAG: hypothetical protein RMK29_12980 [Myxococcales bacterium]|nr:hypothetical protein [Myxococcota bacterium]MDW8282619.1 hypothetical protein [Myxococcales bacterium]